jgi:putative ABC transport system ATP-binding protein
MIRIENLSMVFSPGTTDERTALRNVNLTVRRGDFVTIIGSNGAGKTTLYNVIAGTFIPTSGRILIDDEKTGVERDITRSPEWKRAAFIGRIFQNPTLGTAGNMAIEHNMLIGRKKGWQGLRISLNKRLRESFCDQLKALNMGLENRIGDNVGLLSGGQRQALTLLMTVMSRPALLLLDEHTAALDPSNANMVMDLTLKFARDYNLTVMMITHNMAHALKFGNRLLMMDGGEIILDLNAEEKARLTAADIVEQFRKIKKQDLANDEMLLT